MTGIDRRAALAAALLAAIDPAAAMATRSVALYLQLERGLQDALARHDRAAVTAMLADEFTFRSAALADAESADEWLRREFASPLSEGFVRDLSVREQDDLAVVSLLLDRNRPGRPAAATFFVVDVWRASTQRLASRSVARAADAPPRPSRPSGRE